jgi:hypothetical protein
MATKKRTGRVLDLTTRILLDIREEARRTNERLGVTNERLDVLSHRVDTGFAEVSSRLDTFIEFAGDRYRELEARVRVLEGRNPT